MKAAEALARVRTLLLDEARLVRGVASGRRRGQELRWKRAELRYVDLRAERRLQTVLLDATQSFTSNCALVDARARIDELLAEPFAHWHVETTEVTLQLRFTKKGDALVHEGPPPAGAAPDREHDRAKQRLIAEDHPLWRALGVAGADGRLKPTRRDKVRQVEEFLRALDAALDDAVAASSLRTPTGEQPWHVVDLGCGNAYLTFAAQVHLAERGLPVRFTGVDIKEQSRLHNTAVAEELLRRGVPGGEMRFVTAGIADVDLADVDVVLALHACDTATDDALARGVEWAAGLVLAAPCCHHDVARQLRKAEPPIGYAALLRDGILRERFADTFTDAVRASLLRTHGYRVDVTDFIDSAHTPRNTLLRAVRTGRAPTPAETAELASLLGSWQVTPRLAELLAAQSGATRPGRVATRSSWTTASARES